ncbi:hypothetical protein [uncultured Lacinutrix sp.]|uniref:hypothetical protein n=1 Tax=uncultured Lacinutrix sp. TaxID=574032 RepID=UPI002622E980|nr:hypothetical protein [uncultured Lacinutrix sp.]
MKLLYTTLVCFFAIACNTSKNLNTKTLFVDETILCPEDGICSFNILKNKTYNIKIDEFGNSYSELLDGEKTVLKFEYKRNEIEGFQDSNYREVIYIEIDSKGLELNLTDVDLKKANVGFERYCFCRGQTGAYAISQGNLLLTNIKENEYSITLNFATDKVPHVIKIIKENFTL